MLNCNNHIIFAFAALTMFQGLYTSQASLTPQRDEAWNNIMIRNTPFVQDLCNLIGNYVGYQWLLTRMATLPNYHASLAFDDGPSKICALTKDKSAILYGYPSDRVYIVHNDTGEILEEFDMRRNYTGQFFGGFTTNMQTISTEDICVSFRSERIEILNITTRNRYLIPRPKGLLIANEPHCIGFGDQVAYIACKKQDPHANDRVMVYDRQTHKTKFLVRSKAGISSLAKLQNGNLMVCFLSGLIKEYNLHDSSKKNSGRIVSRHDTHDGRIRNVLEFVGEHGELEKRYIKPATKCNNEHDKLSYNIVAHDSFKTSPTEYAQYNEWHSEPIGQANGLEGIRFKTMSTLHIHNVNLDTSMEIRSPQGDIRSATSPQDGTLIVLTTSKRGMNNHDLISPRLLTYSPYIDCIGRSQIIRNNAPQNRQQNASSSYIQQLLTQAPFIRPVLAGTSIALYGWMMYRLLQGRASFRETCLTAGGSVLTGLAAKRLYQHTS